MAEAILIQETSPISSSTHAWKALTHVSRFSQKMNGEAHHSFKELFAATNPESLPFNQNSDQAGGGVGENSSFLSLQLKRNARTVPNSALLPIQNAFKHLMNPGAKHDEYKVSCNQVESGKRENSYRYAYLDFQRALVPHIEGSSAATIDEYYTDTAAMQPSSPPLHFAHFPTNSQWYLLNQLRIHAGAPERSLAGIDKMSNYYAQLQFLESKFPFDTEEVDIGFIWYGSWFPERQTITKCIQYEKAATLFNIAAVFSQFGALERLGTLDGLKKAAAHFQKAAGILIYIRDVLTARFKVKVDITSDLHETSLSRIKYWNLRSVSWL
jgi:hypothetical protein